MLCFSKNSEKISNIVKIIFSVLTVLMVLVLIIGENFLPENVGKYKYMQTLEGDWTRRYPDGRKENAGQINKREIFDVEGNEPLVLEYTLADSIPTGSFLCIRSSSQAVHVYIDGITRVEYDNAKIRKWGSSNVSRYLFVPLESDDNGKTLKIEYKGEGLYAGMTSAVYMGTLDSLWYKLIQSDGISMLLEVMMAILGLIMLVICGIVYIRKKFKMSLIWLALSMVNTAVYLLCYSISRQLLFPNVTILYDFGFAFSAMTWISYLFYLDEYQNARYRKLYNHTYILVLITVAVSMPMILLSIVDSLNVCIIYMVIYLAIAAIILTGIIKDIKKGLFMEYHNIGSLLVLLIPLQVLLLVQIFGFIETNIGMIYCLMIIIILCTDIFHEVNMIIEDKAKIVRAESANEAKSAFLANMSHEIRTPINSIMGMNEMILRESNNPDILGYAGTISNSSRFLLGIINDILDFSKIEAGKMEIVPVEYSTQEMLNELTGILSERASGKQLKVVINISDDLPSRLCGDVTRVKQIIINILSNACKYTSDGSVSFTMKWETINGQAGLNTVVADTGIGMQPEDLAKLFDKFTRLEEHRNSSIEGTGLGMSIVKYLVDAMNGEIKVDSTYGKGTTVSIFLPQVIVSGEPIGKTVAENKKPENKKYIPKLTAPQAHVLVVDDVNTNLIVFRSLLKKTLIRIDTADSGKKCLEFCAENKYDIIYMDHMMPEMDGEETLHKLRSREGANQDIPVIMLTANAMVGSKEQYIEMGFNAYLSKPIQPQELEQSLIDFLPKEKTEIAGN